MDAFRVRPGQLDAGRMPARVPRRLQGPAGPTGWRWSPTSRWMWRATARSPCT